MNVFIDAPERWEHISSLTTKTGELRHYYLAELPYLALIVCRHDQKLEALKGRTVDAAIGWDRADPGFSRRPGMQQTKITIHGVTDRTAEKRLSALLRGAKRAPNEQENRD